MVQAGERLQREQGHIGAVGYQLLKPRPECSIATEQEMYAGVTGECFGQLRKQFEPLFCSHVAGVKHDDFALNARHLRCKLATDQVETISVRVEGIDRVYIDPVGKED